MSAANVGGTGLIDAALDKINAAVAAGSFVTDNLAPIFDGIELLSMFDPNELDTRGLETRLNTIHRLAKLGAQLADDAGGFHIAQRRAASEEVDALQRGAA